MFEEVEVTADVLSRKSLKLAYQLLNILFPTLTFQPPFVDFAPDWL
jgi:hypothetical protein